MKLYHPDQNATACSFGGQTYERDDAGAFEVPDHASALLDHGFTTTTPAWAQGNQAPTLAEVLAGLKNKGEVVAYGLEHYGLELDEKSQRADLEAAVLAADEAKKSGAQG